MRRVLRADQFSAVVRWSWNRGGSYTKGYHLFSMGQTEVQSVARDRAVVRVSTRARSAQTVTVALVDDDVSVDCTCGQYTEEPCEHAVAACHAMEHHLRENPVFVWQDAVSRAIEAKRSSSATAARGGVIVFGFGRLSYGLRVRPYLVSARDLPDDLPEDPYEVARLVHVSGAHRTAREVHSRSDYSGIRNASPRLIATVALALGSGYYYQESTLKTLAPLLAGCPVFHVDIGGTLGEPIDVDQDEARLVLVSERVPEGVRLTLSATRHGRSTPEPLAGASIVSQSPTWILSGTALFPVSQPDEMVRAFLSEGGIVVPEEEATEFAEEFLAPLAERLEIAGLFGVSREVRDDPVKRVYLQEGEDGLVARLAFGYADVELPFAPDAPEFGIAREPEGSGLVRVWRRCELERAAWKEMSGFGLKRGVEPGEFVLRKSVTAVDFLIHQVPKLAGVGYQVFGEEAITSVRVSRARPSLSLTVSSGIDWFDVEAVVKFGDLDVSWQEVAKAIRRRERYIKLADGSMGVLPDDWTERYRRILGLVGDDAGDMRLGSHQLLVIDELLRDAEDPRVDEEFRRRRERLRDLKGIESRPVPAGFEGELRPYQKAGFDWLHFLHEYGFGGCLADDMGTGKTIQALAFLQSLKERGEATAPSLLVMPRSLLFNWQREAARFTPGLRVLVYADGDRDQTLEELREYDVVLTTYGIMLRDAEALAGLRFHHVILDESQAIKNPLSLTARAARRLEADHRLVLTGTPVENTTLELWSQFAFLNPGLLGSLEYFRKEFALPIERQRDEEAASLLRRMIFPFILRRTKDQVAADLPPRTERILYCEMEPAQQKAYERSRDYYRATLLGLIEEEGMDKARMKILEGLLRLRQICNHPRLVDAKFSGPSGKLDELLEILETLRAEGHKALVFSQFTQMLKLVAETLDSRGIPYVYLDGDTRDRSARVDEFQGNDEVPFFLISLRAGGFGLNLTAADYVIHIDPWWNPAVEMQAADRAHRIGQEKPVFVYRLIMRGSVEEKVLQLQEAKRDLVAQLVQAESGVFKSLNRRDVEVLFS